MQVALFITCFNDVMYAKTGRAVVELLERLSLIHISEPTRPY